VSSTTTTLAVLVLLILVNLVVKFTRNQVWLFWGIQAANLVAAAVAITFGLPGIVAGLKWLVGALMLFHFVQNLQTRMAWQDEERALRREAESRERRRQQELDDEAEQARRAAAEQVPPEP
jgi:hypothetical protein